jgi:RNA polymerase sigma-70 factor (ECF subfamily)
MRIASHLAIDSLRRERKGRRDQLEDVREEALEEGGEGILSTSLGVDPSANLLRRELAGRMQSALDGLPEIHRTILVLREVEGLSYEDLAVRLGIQKGTVMSRLFHARKKMQAALADYAVPSTRQKDGGEE